MNDPFFSGYEQKEVAIRQYRGKSPMFFRDLHLMAAVCTADLAALRRALPPSLRGSPVAVWPGRGLAALACFEYIDTDIGPYNEVALSIPLLRAPRGGGALLDSLRAREVHAYIKDLPVTTEVALFGGLDFFNYPKYLADITFEETAAARVCRVRERESGRLILEFEGPKLPAGKRPELSTAYTYPVFQGRPARARMLINRRQGSARWFPSDVALRLGDSPRAQPLRELGLGRVLRYVFAPANRAILFQPQPLELP